MKSVLVDYRISKKSEDTLLGLGYEVIKSERSANLAEPVCGHPDMLLCKLSDTDFAVSPTLSRGFIKSLNKKHIILGATKLKPIYPCDIAYNAARIGKYLFCNEKHTDAAILKYSKKYGISVINVNQGYTKCSICEVSENAVITSDKSIFKAARENNIDVLLTENSGIILNGYNEGFIGGAGGLIEKNLLAVNGDISLHKNFKEIKEFCKKYGVKK